MITLGASGIGSSVESESSRTDASPRTGDVRVINSPRAGAEKRGVTRWLISQRSMGDCIPKLTSNNIEFAKAVPPLKVTTKVNALLRALGAKYGSARYRISNHAE
jgi:hypothetical protein